MIGRLSLIPILSFLSGLINLAGLSSLASAETLNEQLEQRLVQAMSVTKTRTLESKIPILEYVRHGFLPRKPDRRADYTDYRVMRKPAHLFGNRIIVVEEEYYERFVGCCVNPGISALLSASGDVETLKKFASRNACSVGNYHLDKASAKC